MRHKIICTIVFITSLVAIEPLLLPNEMGSDKFRTSIIKKEENKKGGRYWTFIYSLLYVNFAFFNWFGYCFRVPNEKINSYCEITIASFFSMHIRIGCCVYTSFTNRRMYAFANFKLFPFFTRIHFHFILLRTSTWMVDSGNQYFSMFYDIFTILSSEIHFPSNRFSVKLTLNVFDLEDEC